MFGTNCGGCNHGMTHGGRGNNCCCLLLLLLLCGCGNGFGNDDNCCWNIILLLIILNCCGCGNGFGF
ncbi:MAG: chorion class high-cysteine HCB protein 13 [Christensenellales bacterium]